MDELDHFYAALLGGNTVGSFLANYRRITTRFIHDAGLTKKFRLGSAPAKKPRDEVTPVARFVRKYAADEDRIRFVLDSSFPDCVVEHEDGRVRGIEVTVAQAEVTVAQAKERRYLMTKLNETGTAQGHLRLSDDDSNQDFERRMKDDPMGSETEELGASIVRAVAICVRKKRAYRTDTLLIEAPLESMPADRWEGFGEALAERATELRFFSEVYLTGASYDSSDPRDICLRIK